jgi:hypothetical protein
MPIIKADGVDISIDEEDEPLVTKYTWHLHHGKPRTRIFLFPVGSQELPARPHQIPLERFIYKITPYTNIRIRHLFGDEFNCARSTMFLEKKHENLTSMFFGVVQRGDMYYYALVKDGKETMELGPYVFEIDAAHAHDVKAIELMGWRAKTNFYQQLL